MKKNFILIVFISITCTLFTAVRPIFAQEIIYEKKDLRDSWNTFKNGSRTLEQFKGTKRARSVNLHLKFDRSIDKWLEIEAPEYSYLFINGKYYGPINNTKIIVIDSLMNAGHGNVFDITVYRRAGLSSFNFKTNLYKRSISTGGSPAMRGHDSDFMNFFVLVTSVIFLFIGIIAWKFPRDTNDYFSFLRSLSFKNREETLISTKPFNRTNILFIIFDSVLIGFLIVSLVHLTEGYIHFPMVSRTHTIAGFINDWIISSFIVFGSIIMKYLLIKIFTGIFRFGDFRYIQHFNSLRYSIGTFLLILLLVLFTYLSFRTGGLNAYIIFIKVSVILLIIRILILFFKLRDFTSHRNFHLFSYLCGTEIIPFIILYKLVLG